MANIPFSGNKSWAKKVISADAIWSQVKAVLDANGMKLPETLRRPDVRLIVDNIDGVDRIFKNPANHANDAAEHIPHEGGKTAAMIMIKGDTLAEQYKNAQTLFDTFALGEQGLSAAFVQALTKDGAGGLVAEAYGPAPLQDQAGKLVNVDWKNADGTADHITPVKGAAAAFGARAATNETAINACVHVFIQGTGTIPELIESSGMVIAVSSDWQTGKVSTRPIVASVAKDFYGEHFDTIPQITVHPEGFITKIDLKNGTTFSMVEDPAAPRAALPKQAL